MMNQLPHDIKNSLITLASGVESITLFLPKLIDAYKIAESNKLLLPIVNNKQLDLLSKVSKQLKSEISILQKNLSQINLRDDDNDAHNE